MITTHTGSLPRPDTLVALLATAAGSRPADPVLQSCIREAVRAAVRAQRRAGIDVLNDGEMSKPSYVTYVTGRLRGFDSTGSTPAVSDLAEFPDYARRAYGDALSSSAPACVGEVRHCGTASVQSEIDDLRTALEGVDATEAFLGAASPGLIALFIENRHYPSHEAYVHALADAMRSEYEAIIAAGFLLQLDCPDLGLGAHLCGVEDWASFRRRARQNIDALNYALRGLPPDRMRLHLCWGNYEGPHHRDIPLREIIGLAFAARPAALLFPAANPRHEHEWTLFEEVSVPDGKLLVPGVIDTTTNFIEHPELVTQRVVRLARLVGRENVIAGTDCGFSPFAGHTTVDPSIAWAKLEALADGGRLATRQLW